MLESVMSSVVEFDKPHKSKLHPTMKPVSLVEHFIINSSRRGDVVLDPFGGSGSTMIACEVRGRSAHLIELDERFADTIICRWQDFTGKEAHLSTGESYSEVADRRADV